MRPINLNRRRLESTDKKAVVDDVLKVIPDYLPNRIYTRRLRPDGSLVELIEVDGETVHEPFEYVSGNRIDVFDIGDETLEPAEYDKDGNQTKAPVMAGKRRLRIELPDYKEMPEMVTLKK